MYMLQYLTRSFRSLLARFIHDEHGIETMQAVGLLVVAGIVIIALLVLAGQAAGAVNKAGGWFGG
jgi:hypothetical protein